MGPCTDLECVVCFHEFNPDHHMPRVLECQHTFCTPCLQRLCQQRKNHLAICCPLCRQVTCVSASLTLTCSLLIDINVWSQIIEVWRQKRGPEEGPEYVFTDWKSVETKSSSDRGERVKRHLQKLRVFLMGY